MFPDMRRKKQMLSDQDSVDILTSGIYGVLGTTGTDAWPYAVPISYAFDPTPDAEAGAPAGRIYLHSAVTGHKLGAIEENPHVSFAVVGHNEVAPEQLTNIFRSVIAFGCARRARDVDEKCTGLVALGAKYCPGLDDFVTEEIVKSLDRTEVIVIDLERITGKEAIELVRERQRP